MALTTAGRDHISGLILGEALTAFNNANAYLGVGDSSTAFAVGQADLQAATNKVRVGMMVTFPSRAVNVLSFKSSFGSAVANYTWSEWGVFNASTGGVMLSRKVDALGVKAAGSTWELTATLTLTV